MQTILVTGAAGFIGSTLCRYLRREGLARVIGVDALTYAGNRESLGILANDPLFSLIVCDVTDVAAMSQLMVRVSPDSIIHLAAETHVDRSIDSPSDFLRSNVVGTFSLLETIRAYFPYLPEDKRKAFRFLHVSTDEIFGGAAGDSLLNEHSPYNPHSPYAASKAAADHFVNAWFHTYGLPVITTHSSNNYGPLQFPEKLIPLCITKGMRGEALPLYGDGQQSRDWLYVEDHVRALYLILMKGQVGARYNIGGSCEKRNKDVVEKICDLLDIELDHSLFRPHRNLISFVQDRPGHDQRYAVDYSKLQSELGWKPQVKFEDGLRETVRWYIDNQIWCNTIKNRKYAGERLGLLT